MIISFKMVDGSRIDVQANKYQKEALLNALEEDHDFTWWQVESDNGKKIILRGGNIVSITIKGDGDDR